MATLVLRFTGLCGFVPTHRTVPRDTMNEVRVLLAAAGNPAGAGGHHEHHHGDGANAQDEEHVPVIYFANALLGQQSRQPDITFQKQSVLQGLCLLSGQEVTIGNSAPHALLVHDGVPDADLKCPKNNSSLFYWVAPMARINRAGGAVDPAVLARGATLSPAVAARFVLTQGTLSAVPPPVKEEVLSWGFKRRDQAANASQHEQAIAEEVELRMPIDDSGVAFEAADLRGNLQFARLWLKPQDDGTVFATVANLPLVDIVARRPQERIVLGEHRRADDHFDHYFRFCADGPQEGRGNIPFPVRKCQGGDSVSHPRCPPAQFSPLGV